eukprot:CAMPEP_0181177122 /NCGR_PEP_ID=MMETSP1096-20121128/4999_1 /TAXON_ID=156174 ORGANISM="Chrysochromulina ericina, Strain CCMP281" /NCGR_SAMPLE_ID=MMETSP1096 /ASSEMBLY_ACC=CAM_ASM_000453 /LENGTH=99 /DNA_ID=CAMNT_0023265265 /DNA_START=260 /DNA_END=559 /DNA_ORIENTATION=-
MGCAWRDAGWMSLPGVVRAAGVAEAGVRVRLILLPFVPHAHRDAVRLRRRGAAASLAVDGSEHCLRQVRSVKAALVPAGRADQHRRLHVPARMGAFAAS